MGGVLLLLFVCLFIFFSILLVQVKEKLFLHLSKKRDEVHFLMANTLQPDL